MGAARKQSWGKIITEVHRTLVFLVMCYHYRNRILCRVSKTLGKGYFTLGKAFAECNTWQRTLDKYLIGKKPNSGSVPFFFLRFFFKYFFIFFYFAAAHKKITHQVSDFFCAMTRPLEFLQVCPQIRINVWKMRSPISKPNLGILKTANPAKTQRIGCKI
jgi:hypothetical protein